MCGRNPPERKVRTMTYSYQNSNTATSNCADERTVTILAKSTKNHGYCVAGIYTLAA